MGWGWGQKDQSSPDEKNLLPFVLAFNYSKVTGEKIIYYFKKIIR